MFRVFADGTLLVSEKGRHLRCSGALPRKNPGCWIFAIGPRTDPCPTHQPRPTYRLLLLIRDRGGVLPVILQAAPRSSATSSACAASHPTTAARYRKCQQGRTRVLRSYANVAQGRQASRASMATLALASCRPSVTMCRPPGAPFRLPQLRQSKHRRRRVSCKRLLWAGSALGGHTGLTPLIPDSRCWQVSTRGVCFQQD